MAQNQTKKQTQTKPAKSKKEVKEVEVEQVNKVAQTEQPIKTEQPTEKEQPVKEPAAEQTEKVEATTQTTELKEIKNTEIKQKTKAKEEKLSNAQTEEADTPINMPPLTINKVSFYVIAAVAGLYLISLIFALFRHHSLLIGVLQGIATAAMISIVAMHAWKYVKGKSKTWKIVYIVCLALVLVGVVIPLI